MKTIAAALGLLLLGACAAETETTDTLSSTTTQATESQTTQPPATDSAAPVSLPENAVSGTWAGQVKVGQPVSMFNYVGAESGDFAPMRFTNDSEAGKKILAVCGTNDDECEFTGAVEWLDEPPPPDASAIGQILRVDSVRLLQRGAG